MPDNPTQVDLIRKLSVIELTKSRQLVSVTAHIGSFILHSRLSTESYGSIWYSSCASDHTVDHTDGYVSYWENATVNVTWYYTMKTGLLEFYGPVNRLVVSVYRLFLSSCRNCTSLWDRVFMSQDFKSFNSRAIIIYGIYIKR